MAEEEDFAAEAADAPRGNNKKILPLILVINTLLMAGVLVFVMKKPSGSESARRKSEASAAEHGEAKDEREKELEADKDEGGEHGEGETARPSIHLDNFIVSIRAAEGDRFAHATMEVEVGSEADKKAFETRMPRIRDAILSYLSDRTEDDLRGSEGLRQLKEAIVKKLDEIVPGHRVRGLYITEFLIQ
jgi:flagellar protein FliL